MESPVRLLNNVIRLDLEDKSKECYETITESIIEAAEEFQKGSEIKEKPLIEFTFGSRDLEENFPKLLEKHKGVEICLGTVCNKDEALQAIKWSKGSKLKVFAPHYSKEVKECFEGTDIQYIPGMRTMDEYKRFIKDHRTMNSKQIIKCKVYPCTSGNEEELLNAISGPYPELRLKENRERVLVGLKTIEKDTLSAKTYMIKTPFEYSQIRELFLKDKELKFIIQKPSIEAIELIKYMRQEEPEAYITATGMNKIGEEEIKLLKAGADSLGTAAAVKDALKNFKEGKIELTEMKAQIKTKLLKTYEALK